MTVSRLGGGAFTVAAFLTPAQCRGYIALSESRGYDEAAITLPQGPQVLKEVRNNDRILWDDAGLAARLFAAAQALLPAQIDAWQLCGFNERMRFYRYGAEQYFKWHRDGTFRRSEHEESMLTFMIYLNDAFTGGETRFSWDVVQPREGMALVFPHRLMHQGCPVTSGTKYVLRTDVMYRRDASVPA